MFFNQKVPIGSLSSYRATVFPVNLARLLAVLLSLSCFTFQASAQTQLITASDGGFENATSTFAANGWSEAQPGNSRQWWVGTAAGAASGTKSAYMGQNSNNNGSNVASVQHFYRDIAIPSTATTVRLQFYLKRTTASASDRFRVFITSTSNTPVSGTFPTTGYTAVYSDNTTTYASFTQMTAINLDSYAGTTIRLVFTAEENGSNPRSNPAVDNITISCNVPPVISSLGSASGCSGGNITINGTYLSSATSVTIGGTAVSSITSNTATQIVAVIGSGTTGTVSVTTAQGSGNSASSFTVNPRPTAYNVTGGGSYCSGGSGVAVGLSGSQVGVNYTLSPGGTVVAGTGSAISFGNRTVAATYTVSATNATTGCTNNMTGSAVVTINSNPTAYNVTGGGAYCSGGSGVAVGLSGSQVGVNYTLSPGGTVVAGTGAAISFGNQTAAATYTATATVVATGCTSNMNGSAVVTINASPTVYAVTGGGDYCFGGSGVAVGLAGSQVGVNYTLTPGGTVIAGTGSAINFGNQTTAATYTISGTNTSNGCSMAMSGNAVVTLSYVPAFTTQPTDQTVCSGDPVSFSVVATGGLLNYRWYKGNTMLSNGGAISGATSATLTINPAVSGDASTDYHCVITNNCGNETSDYVELVVNAAATAPLAQPTTLTFPTIGVTSVIGSFTASSSANGYLVVRTSTAAAPTNPSDGTTYSVGSTALGATTYVEYSGPFTTFTSNGLNQGTTYYYWVYAYNSSSCGSSPKYLTSSPLNASVTTATNISCGSINTLYWAGTGSGSTNPSPTSVFNTASNWSTSSSSYVASASAPTGCTNVFVNINSGNATITLNANASVYNLDFKVTNNRAGMISTEGFTFTVNGNADIDLATGSGFNSRIYIGENNGSAAGIVDFKGNLTIGTNAATWPTNKISYFRGNINSKIICRADVTLGRTFAISSGSRPGTIEFDGVGLQQVLWNNDLYFANFYNVVVGNSNSPICRHVTGTYTPDNIMNNLTINNSAVLDLATSQWIRDAAGGTFSMNNSSKMILSNSFSIPSPSSGLGIVVPGSNFPGGFTTMNISSNSTIEYDAAPGINQTIYATPTYGNLILSNESGTGTSLKTNTGTITVTGTTQLQENTTWTLGAGVVSNGAMSVKNGGTFETNNQVVSGSGSFTTEAGSTLIITSTQGISSSGATGNIQTTTRSFSTAGNYTYNGSSLTSSGTGLPATMNNLTINNSGGVTLSGSGSTYTVSGTLRLTSGPIGLNGKTLSINNLIRSSGTISSSTTSSLVVNGTSIPLYFSAGARFIKNLTLGNNASASLGTTLDMVGGSTYGTLTIGSGATLTTNDRLTLRSTSTGTARIAEIPAHPTTGAALGFISGNVTVERYVSAQRAWRLLAVPTDGSQTIKQSWQENQASGSTSLATRGFQITGETYPANGFDGYSSVPSVKYWNPGTQAYVGISSTLNPIANDYGYMAFIRGDRTITTTSQSPVFTVIRTSGSVKTGKYPSSAISVGAGQWVSIANPYASAINFNNVTRTGGVPNTFYVWDPLLTSGSGSRYGFGGFRTITWDSGSGSYIVTPSGGSYTSNTDIESGSAFFVYAPLSAGTVSFLESSKTNGSNLVSRPVEPSGKQLKVNLYVYSNSEAIMIDGNLTQFGPGYSNQLDELDALKLSNTGENIGISRNRKAYIVERRADILQTDTIPFVLGQMKQRTYKMELTASRLSDNMTAFLEDKFLQTRTPLNLEGTTNVEFTVTNSAPGSYASDRFRVVFNSLTRVPQPVISRFTANRGTDNRIALQWDVTQEARIQKYDIERSLDAVHFRSISVIDPVANNGSNTTYRQLDAGAPTGNISYRIKGTLLNGNGEIFSQVVNLTGTNSNVNDVLVAKGENMHEETVRVASVSVYPNPVVNKQINLLFRDKTPGNYKLQLIGSGGQVLYRGQIKAEAGNQSSQINVGETVPAGSYQLSITGTDGNTENIPLIIL